MLIKNKKHDLEHAKNKMFSKNQKRYKFEFQKHEPTKNFYSLSFFSFLPLSYSLSSPPIDDLPPARLAIINLPLARPTA